MNLNIYHVSPSCLGSDFRLSTSVRVSTDTFLNRIEFLSAYRFLDNKVTGTTNRSRLSILDFHYRGMIKFFLLSSYFLFAIVFAVLYVYVYVSFMVNLCFVFISFSYFKVLCPPKMCREIQRCLRKNHR